MRHGSTNAVMHLTKPEQLQLWEGVWSRTCDTLGEGGHPCHAALMCVGPDAM